jgi:hypothetical protein
MAAETGQDGPGTDAVRAGTTAEGASTPAVEEADEFDSVGGHLVGSAGTDVVREIDHDEFDPIGTLVLIVVYMAILGAMWVFMYFVEFLGGDLTVIG